jgi:hypothetical protein
MGEVYKITDLLTIVGKWRSWLAQQTVNLLVESSNLSFPATFYWLDLFFHSPFQYFQTFVDQRIHFICMRNRVEE